MDTRKWAIKFIMENPTATESILKIVLDAVYLEGKSDGILGKPEEK